tara:strand:- start:85584 stop:86174 length:591 start_codon:yes stop_codon:yes gene_type:complete
MMLLRAQALSHVLLIRPGATEFDDQGRIKGSLDMPLSDEGHRQAETMVAELADVQVKAIYTSPCESARQTAEYLAKDRGAKIRVVDCLGNVDHGLWHGKLIDEVKRNHPKIYRQGIESPDQVCPPGGESMIQAKARVAKFLRKTVRKNRDEVIAIIVPDPLALLIHSLLSGEEPQSDLWTSETDAADWQLVEAELN